MPRNEGRKLFRSSRLNVNANDFIQQCLNYTIVLGSLAHIALVYARLARVSLWANPLICIIEIARPAHADDVILWPISQNT